MGNYERPQKGGTGSQSRPTRPCSVYGLYSTEDTVIRYIGQTVQTLERRRTQHLAEATRPPGRSRCHRWIRKVLRSGFMIGVQLIEADCPWNEAEQRWIAFYRSIYPQLMTNLSDGGCGYNGKRSLATRRRMSGRRLSASHIAKLRLPKSPETRARMSMAQVGNKNGRGEYNGQAILSEEDVIDIRRSLVRGKSLTRIAVRYGVSKAAISKIRTGRTWRHL